MIIYDNLHYKLTCRNNVILECLYHISFIQSVFSENILFKSVLIFIRNIFNENILFKNIFKRITL